MPSHVINLADAPAFQHPVSGVRILLESPDAPFADTGVNIQVLRPGQPNCKYHSEGVQEDFLVLAGECLALIDGEERALRTWDFVHIEAGTPHVFVGGGDALCFLLAIGARREPEEFDFPVDDRAAAYGASARRSTSSGDEAYADWEGGPPPGAAPRVKTPWPPG